MNIATRSATAPAASFDPIMLEVIRCLLIAMMDECEINLSRTAFSPIIYEVKDYCIGLLDKDGRTIAQSRGSVPTFVADLGDPVRDGIEIYGKDGFEPGDVLVTNFSDVCGQHLNNIVIYLPIFVGDDMVGFMATRAHWTDVGGRISGSVSTDTTEIFQEGIQLRSLKVYKRGEPDLEIMRVIRHNVRYPDLCFGDMDAQIAACEHGRQRFVAMIEKYGRAVVEGSIQAIWDRSERVMRERIQQIPDGRYIGESFLDDDGVTRGKMIPIKIAVIVEGNNITVDYSELSPQTPGPMNAGRSGGISAAKVAIKSALVPDIPANDGTFRAVHITLPDGTLMSATNNAALSLWTVTIKTIVDTILRALSGAVPDRIPAAHHGSMGVYIFSGQDKDNGRRFSTVDSVLGGWGAQPDGDGFSPLKTVTHGDTSQVPVEVEETFWPVEILCHEWRPDSAGPGRWRGGLGLRKLYRLPHGARATIAFERSKCPPWGLFGGGSAQVGCSYVRQPGDKDGKLYHKVTGLEVAPGGTVELLSAGGGGRGFPDERPVNLVIDDVKRGYVTVEGARRDYGVVFDAVNGRLDESATEQVRQETRAKRTADAARAI
jgi:N-methylhydantoinase B